MELTYLAVVERDVCVCMRVSEGEDESRKQTLLRAETWEW